MPLTRSNVALGALVTAPSVIIAGITYTQDNLAMDSILYITVMISHQLDNELLTIITLTNTSINTSIQTIFINSKQQPTKVSILHHFTATKTSPTPQPTHPTIKMQFSTATLIALLSAASLTMAAPHHKSNKVNPIYNPGQAQTKPPTQTKPQPQQGASLQARLQLELERQTTFIQRVIPVPGRLEFNSEIFSAFIVSVKDVSSGKDVSAGAVCQAFDVQKKAIGRPIVLGDSIDLNGGLAADVAFITCEKA